MAYDFSGTELKVLKPLVSTRAYNGLLGGGHGMSQISVWALGEDGVNNISKIPNVSRQAASRIVDWIKKVYETGDINVQLDAGVEEEVVEVPVERTLKYRRIKNVFTSDEITAILRPHLEKKVGKSLKSWKLEIEPKLGEHATYGDDPAMLAAKVSLVGVTISATSPLPVVEV